MNLNLQVKTIRSIFKPNEKSDIDERIRYQDNESTIAISIESFDDKDLKRIQKALEGIADTNRFAKQSLRKIKSYNLIKEDPDGVKVKTLENLVPALKQYIKKNSKSYWLYRIKDEEGIALPYIVTNIQYNKAVTNNGRLYPPYVSMKLKYFDGGVEQDSVTWHREAIKEGVTVRELLYKTGYSLNNEELDSNYNKQLKRFYEYKHQVGSQFSGIMGHGHSTGRWDYNETALVKNGVMAKLVIDEEEEKNRGEQTVTDISFWTKKQYEDDDDDEDDDNADENNYGALPVHPYLYVFHLVNHTNMYVHVDYVKPYVWDETIYDKLILPADVKNLVSILTQGSKFLMDDIVSGKTGGIIVLATGVPGTGKTLTAEVYSEVIKRPLYVVQSSQLGVNPDELEEELKKVLERAARWNAILLIDEADVYIHERGDDIEQNAMVGVFLRVLEYYRGVLFMTSNRATVIDDAIVSRATAHIRYEIPDRESRIKIWEVLMKQFKIDVKNQAKLITTLSDEFPLVSGRDIKNMLKLAKLLADEQKKELTVDSFKFVERFLNVNKEK